MYPGNVGSVTDNPSSAAARTDVSFLDTGRKVTIHMK